MLIWDLKLAIKAVLEQMIPLKDENQSILCRTLKVMSPACEWDSKTSALVCPSLETQRQFSDVLCFRTDFATTMLLIGSQVS